MGLNGVTAYLISHTHWDREWYLPFHRFRVNLVEVVDQVLARLESDPSFSHFLLDGQAVILEDYLEARPEARERIGRLVQEGALSVGPWYVLPDEFLVSGESTVRNLLYGHSVAASFGPVQKVGYMPDSFGHIAQMPQILARAGIGSFVYTRGNGDELEELGLEYRWRAPDGSEVLAIKQWGGYCNAAALGHEEPWHVFTQREVDPGLVAERMGGLLNEMRARSNARTFLLMNGCDHHPPQRKLAEALDAMTSAFPDVHFVHGSLGDYLEQVGQDVAAPDGGPGGSSGPEEAVKTFSGELLGGRYHHILSGVWSARMNIKQRNDQAQTLLTGYVEPLLSYAHFMLGRDYPAGLIDYAWKLLLKNHPHDSICGCSTDTVHREMEPRFAGVCETGEQLLSAELEHMAPVFARREEDDDELVICVANPLPFRRTEVVERLVVFVPPGPETHKLRLLDEDGSVVPFTVVSKRYVERFWGVDYRGELFSSRQGDLFRKYIDHFGDRIVRSEAERESSDCFLTIQFVARDLPALGHANYYLHHEEPAGESGCCGPPPTVRGVRVGDNTLENEFVRVTLHHNGTFDLEDLVAGEVYPDLNLYEDSEDAGDEYDYSPAPNPMILTSAETFGDVRTLRDTGLEGVLEVRYDLHLPSGIERNREHRRPDTVACRTATRVRLRHGSPVAEVEVVFDNRARDHRLRAVFPTPVVTRTLVSDGHFLVNERPIDRAEGADWVQPPPATRPQQDFSLVCDGKRGLAIFNRGLPEIEAVPCRSADGIPNSGAQPAGEAPPGPAGRPGGGRPPGITLKLTLLRCVGWLSRDDFATRRRSNAGPMIHTPDAQCLGTHRIRYALMPFTGDYAGAGVVRRSLEYRVPVLTKQGVRDRCIPGGRGFLEKRDGRVTLSAVKRHRERDTLTVRLCNLSSEEVRETLTTGARCLGAWRTDLLEERLEELATDGRTVSVALGPHEIVTLELEFDRDGEDEQKEHS